MKTVYKAAEKSDNWLSTNFEGVLRGMFNREDLTESFADDDMKESEPGYDAFNSFPGNKNTFSWIDEGLETLEEMFKVLRKKITKVRKNFQENAKNELP